MKTGYLTEKLLIYLLILIGVSLNLTACCDDNDADNNICLFNNRKNDNSQSTSNVTYSRLVPFEKKATTSIFPARTAIYTDENSLKNDWLFYGVGTTLPIIDFSRWQVIGVWTPLSKSCQTGGNILSIKKNSSNEVTVNYAGIKELITPDCQNSPHLAYELIQIDKSFNKISFSLTQ